MVSFCKIQLLLVCIILSQLGLSCGRFRQLLQQQEDNLNTTLCVWDDKIGCKANPLVKNYLKVHSFEEQQKIGASQCIVEDNPDDCNALPACNYKQDIDGNYDNIFDKPDQQMCVQAMGDVNNLQDLISQTDVKEQSKNMRNCFEPGSYWYTIADCQSRDVCEGLCGEQHPELGGLCTPDVNLMNSTQKMMFLNSSLVLIDSIESGDSDSLRQLAIRDISLNGSYFCTSVFPVIFPCIGGILGTQAADDCYLGNPAKFYWRDSKYLDMFDRSQKCSQNTQLDCEKATEYVGGETPEKQQQVQQAKTTNEEKKQQVQHLQTTNKEKKQQVQQLQTTNEEDGENFSVRMDIAQTTLIFSFLLFVFLFQY